MDFSISVKKRIFAFILALFVCVNVIVLDTIKVNAAIGIDDILLAVTVAVIGGVESSSTYQDAYDQVIRPQFRECLREILGIASGQPVDPDTFNRVFPNLGPDPIQECRRWVASKLNKNENEVSDN